MVKWEGILAGVAAVSGLILVSKTTTMRKEAETIVFNARQPKAKITKILKTKPIKNPILKQMIADKSSPYFCVKYPYVPSFRVQDKKAIGVSVQDVNSWSKNHLNINTINKEDSNALRGIGWSKPWKSDKNIEVAIVLESIKQNGGDWQYYLEKIPSYYGREPIERMINEEVLPSRQITEDEIDEALNPAPNYPMNGVRGQEYISLIKDAIVRGKKLDGKEAYFNNNRHWYDDVRKAFNKLGSYIYDKLSYEDQLKSNILIEQKGFGRISSYNQGFRTLGYFDKKYDFKNYIGEPSNEEIEAMIEYWIVLNTLLLYEGYDQWTKEWEESGYNINEVVLVENIRNNLDLYRNRRAGVPKRYNLIRGVLTESQIETISYPRTFITKLYMKNRGKYQKIKTSLQNQMNSILASNLGSEEQEAKNRLIVGTKTNFADYIVKRYPKFGNNPSAIPSSDFSQRILPYIDSDFNLAKDLLSESEKKALFTTYETITNAQILEEQTKSEDASNRLIQELQDKINTRRNQMPINKQGIKDRGDAKIEAFKKKLGL